MLSPYKHITYDSTIIYLAVRWIINTGRFAKKNKRGMRLRYVEQGIDRLMYMLKRFTKVLEVRLDSRSERYVITNNKQFLKLLQNFIERINYLYGDCAYMWAREVGNDSDHPHYHVVLWLNGYDVSNEKPIQTIWEEIHHKRDHQRPYDWKGDQYPQGRMLNGIPSGTSDFAERLSYLCKLTTKGACTGGYDFGCSHLPKAKAEVIELNRGGSTHAV